MRKNIVDASMIKQVNCHFTRDRVFVVMRDNRILQGANRKFVEQESPVEHNETIVSLVTGYNFEVLVVGKKKSLRLRPGWKFDDIDVRTK